MRPNMGRGGTTGKYARRSQQLPRDPKTHCWVMMAAAWTVPLCRPCGPRLRPLVLKSYSTKGRNSGIAPSEEFGEHRDNQPGTQGWGTAARAPRDAGPPPDRASINAPAPAAAKRAAKNAGAVWSRGKILQDSREANVGKTEVSTGQMDRLKKVMARAGIASTRAAERMVEEGRVVVNGVVATHPGQPVDPRRDAVIVDGVPVGVAPQRRFVFMLNKPKGYYCSSARIGEERIVLDLFKEWLEKQGNANGEPETRSGPPGAGHSVTSGLKGRESSAKIAPGTPFASTLPPRLFTVGRLDVPTTGLILVTNDGSFGHKVLHPSNGIVKEYVLTLASRPTARQIARLTEGCYMDGSLVEPVHVGLVNDGKGEDGQRVRIVVAEGKNREVRRLADHAAIEVKGLKRIAIGGLRMPNSLGIGAFKLLTQREQEALFTPWSLVEGRW